MENNNSKLKILFVGGLDATANEEILYSAFIPFGVIKEVHIPKDFQKSECNLLFKYLYYSHEDICFEKCDIYA